MKTAALLRRAVALGLLLLLGSCSLAPPYQRPEIATANQYQESVAGLDWVPFPTSEPSPPWWQALHDPTLNQLEQQAQTANQDLQAAVARLQQGHALAQAQWANLWPVLDAQATHQVTQISEHTSVFPVQQFPAYQTNQVQLQLNYEIDLWGGLRNAARQADALSEASAADLAALTLSVQTDIALDYEAIRALDLELIQSQRLLDNWSTNRHFIQQLRQGAEAALPEQAQADLNWQSAQAQVHTLQLQRRQLVHALALLVGANPDQFQLPQDPLLQDLPAALRPQPGLPSTLLARRPDIVSAERHLQAANAALGVAKSAWFPQFNLTGGFGYGNTGYGPLSIAPNRIWSYGPSMTLPLFNGGQIAAANALAQAQWNETVARYRQTVLTAWREVEDQLTALDEQSQALDNLRSAEQAAQLAQQQAQLRAQAGLASALDTLPFERNAAQQEMTRVQLQLKTLSASLLLIKALGGGWQ